jgi:hypothetical protein
LRPGRTLTIALFEPYDSSPQCPTICATIKWYFPLANTTLPPHDASVWLWYPPARVSSTGKTSKTSQFGPPRHAGSQRHFPCRQSPFKLQSDKVAQFPALLSVGTLLAANPAICKSNCEHIVVWRLTSCLFRHSLSHYVRVTLAGSDAPNHWHCQKRKRAVGP